MAYAIIGSILEHIGKGSKQTKAARNKRRVNPWAGVRVGEASHPGPGGSRRTARTRAQRNSGGGPAAPRTAATSTAACSGINVQVIMQIVQILQLLTSNGGLQQVLHAVQSIMDGATPASSQGKPPKERKRKTGNSRTTRAAATEPEERTATEPPRGPPPEDRTAAASRRPPPEERTNADPPRKPGDSEWTTVAHARRAKAAEQWQLRKEDWKGTIHSLDSMSTALESTEWPATAVVQVHSKDEILQLGYLLKGSTSAGKPPPQVTAAWRCASREEATKEVTSMADTLASVRALPGRLGGRILTEWCVLYAFNGGCPAASTPKRVAGPTIKATVVVRVSAERRYAGGEKWTAMQARPAATARAWVRDYVPPEKARAVHDMWGFEERASASGRKSVLTGLLRADAGAVPALINASGKGGWFAEPLRWEEPLEAPLAIPPMVVWLVVEDNEWDDDYHKRALSLAGPLGLARGDRQLGVRQERRPSDAPRTRTWRIDGAPREWQEGELTQVLCAAGFACVEPISKSNRGRKVLWWVRATALEESFLEIQCDNTVLMAVAQAATPNGGRGMVRKVRDRPTQIFAQERPGASTVDRPALAKPAQENEMEQDGGTEAKAESAAKRQAAAIAKPVGFTLPEGLRLVDNAGQGDCLFLALATCLRQTGGKTVNGPLIRAKIVAHMKRHAKRYETFWDSKKPQAAEEECPSWGEYLELLSAKGAWGSCLEVAAAAATFDRVVTIFGSDTPPQTYNVKGANGHMFLWYAAGHYQAALRTDCGDEEKELKELPQALKLLVNRSRAGDLKGCRGGGKRTANSGAQSSASSARTRPSTVGEPSAARLPQSATSKAPSRKSRSSARPAVSHQGPRNNDNAKSMGTSACTRPSTIESPSPGQTRASTAPARTVLTKQRSCSSPGADPPDAQHGEDSPKQQASRPDQPAGKPEQLASRGRKRATPAALSGWACPICGWKLKGRNNMSKHIRVAHPGVELDMREKGSLQLAMTSVIKIGPEEQAEWRCPHCPMGQRVATGTGSNKAIGCAAVDARTHHFERCHPDADPDDRKQLKRAANQRNSKLANAAWLNATAVRRIAAIQRGEGGAHSLGVLSRHWCKRSPRLFCYKCGITGTNCATMAKRPCDHGLGPRLPPMKRPHRKKGHGLGQRPHLLRRALKWLLGITEVQHMPDYHCLLQKVAKARGEDQQGTSLGPSTGGQDALPASSCAQGLALPRASRAPSTSRTRLSALPAANCSKSFPGRSRRSSAHCPTTTTGKDAPLEQ